MCTVHAANKAGVRFRKLLHYLRKLIMGVADAAPMRRTFYIPPHFNCSIASTMP